MGRYTASNYGVLKIVFEMNLKLFQQECSKKILIVLRDFDPKRNDREKIVQLIMKDIMTIWAEIKKPEKFKDSQPSSFFEFDFVTLPHKKYCEEQFEQAVDELRLRLNSNDPQYFFKHASKEKNVPADGLKCYINQIWGDIINEKELNIPSQKEMLSNYRCNEIKDTILLNCEEEIRNIISVSANKLIDDFKETCTKIYNKALQEYDKLASNYVEKIYQNVKLQIIESFSQKFFIAFANQTKRITTSSQKFFGQDIVKELKSSKIYFLYF